MFSELVLDHFRNPRNAGKLANATVEVQATNPVCGDILRVSLQVRDGRVTEIRFKAKGCVPSMACASALTELVEGQTLAETRALKRDMLIAAVGGLPQASTHAAQLALDALSAALSELQP